MMRHLSNRLMLKLLLWATLSCFLTGQSESPATHREILVESLSVVGTKSIASAELAEITNEFSGSKFKDDSEELGERLRAQFQEHGFFNPKIQKLDITPIDPLGSPKPVRIEAEVLEGQRCQFSGVEFVGNRALSSDEFRAKFSMKAGDLFKSSKVRTGIESVRRAYEHEGFLDAVSIPKTTFDGSTAKLSMEVREGPQYHMGSLEVAGPTEIADLLQARWELQSGAVFDEGYVDAFLDKNSSLLPSDFVRYDHSALLKDCPKATVSVHLHLTKDPQHLAKDAEQRVACKDSDEPKKQKPTPTEK